MQQRIILGFLILVICTLSESCSNSDIIESPNIIVIIADDQGWGDIGYNNPADSSKWINEDQITWFNDRGMPILTTWN